MKTKSKTRSSKLIPNNKKIRPTKQLKTKVINNTTASVNNILENPITPFIITKLEQIFTKPEDLQSHLSSHSVNTNFSNKSITVNTNKVKRSVLIKWLEKKGLSLVAHKWNPFGVYITTDSNNKDDNSKDIPLAATPEYLAGLYFIQSSSSIIPAINLLSDVVYNTVTRDNSVCNDNKGSKMSNKPLKVLDLCASPGGKTVLLGVLLSSFDNNRNKNTHLSTRASNKVNNKTSSSVASSNINNSSIIHANDINSTRLPPLLFNIRRYNLQNIYVTSLDGTLMTKQVYGLYDRILVDAPCSGSGTIHKDPAALHTTEAELIKYITLQKKLILSAYDLLIQTKGVMVYSTCSVLTEENESIIQYLLNNRKDAKLETLLYTTSRENSNNDAANNEDNSNRDILGIPGFTNFRGEHYHSSLNKTRRYYRIDGGDGFFVAKIRKN
ncbi:25S rRNA (cytosine-C(5))-methyltransferase nop2 [Cucumispora dikerogammari]|nr:25S rRNA (cytosine-C(5))-methyltransferase nop2 [Cucumispora dikerogammari]